MTSSSREFEAGCSPCWLNGFRGCMGFFEKDRIFLVVTGELVGDVSSSNPLSMFQKVKLLQQRYPSVQVMGFQFRISVDEGGNCLFPSNTNHHWIITFHIGAKIGSSPGFEDGEFENAKLMRPAASFYHAPEDCLYFADSELWKKTEVDNKPDKFHSNSLLFPWHLRKSTRNDLFVINRSFGTLWVMDLASGVIKEVIKGFPNVMEICGQTIMEKLSVMKHIPNDRLQQHIDITYSVDGIPHPGLMSSVAKFKDDVAFSDAGCYQAISCQVLVSLGFLIGCHSLWSEFAHGEALVKIVIAEDIYGARQ
ncbi:hypothetical protein ACH5RR_010448 [Cinchona calisaya]|uniref:Uncharacterized protein n=1 Tax=Cinchona calisaya TaxID=153742 RepID=A0ABD3AIZ4_9GENT